MFLLIDRIRPVVLRALISGRSAHRAISAFIFDQIVSLFSEETTMRQVVVLPYIRAFALRALIFDRKELNKHEQGFSKDQAGM